MTIKGIFDYIIKNKRKIYLNLNQQLLIYIRDKEEVEKSKVVKVIEMGFTLLGRKNKLVVFANGIGRSIIYIILGINN